MYGDSTDSLAREQIVKLTTVIEELVRYVQNLESHIEILRQRIQVLEIDDDGDN